MWQVLSHCVCPLFRRLACTNGEDRHQELEDWRLQELNDDRIAATVGNCGGGSAIEEWQQNF